MPCIRPCFCTKKSEFTSLWERFCTFEKLQLSTRMSMTLLTLSSATPSNYSPRRFCLFSRFHFVIVTRVRNTISKNGKTAIKTSNRFSLFLTKSLILFFTEKYAICCTGAFKVMVINHIPYYLRPKSIQNSIMNMINSEKSTRAGRKNAIVNWILPDFLGAP